MTQPPPQDDEGMDQIYDDVQQVDNDYGQLEDAYAEEPDVSRPL